MTKYQLFSFTGLIKFFNEGDVLISTMTFTPEEMFKSLYKITVVNSEHNEYRFIDCIVSLLMNKTYNVRSFDRTKSFEISLHTSYGFKKPKTIEDMLSLLESIFIFLEDVNQVPTAQAVLKKAFLKEGWYL